MTIEPDMRPHPNEKPARAKSVLFVCTGNICRSPTAEAVLRAHAAKARIALRVESRGTQGYHAGEPPDPRARRHAGRRGYSMDGMRSRRIADADFAEFDLILACDRSHRAALLERAPAEARAKIRMFRADGGDIPDPYYQGPEAFEAVLDAVEAECARLLDEVAR
jgi:protein-tyrosine phosphatase